MAVLSSPIPRANNNCAEFEGLPATLALHQFESSNSGVVLGRKDNTGTKQTLKPITSFSSPYSSGSENEPLVDFPSIGWINEDGDEPVSTQTSACQVITSLQEALALTHNFQEGSRQLEQAQRPMKRHRRENTGCMSRSRAVPSSLFFLASCSFSDDLFHKKTTQSARQQFPRLLLAGAETCKPLALPFLSKDFGTKLSLDDFPYLSKRNHTPKLKCTVSPLA